MDRALVCIKGKKVRIPDVQKNYAALCFMKKVDF